LLEYLTQEVYGKEYSASNPTKQDDVQGDAEEQYVSYVFLKQSSPQHNKLKGDLKDNFTTGYNKYPKTRQQVLLLLANYTK
jgi:hypothetical protein